MLDAGIWVFAIGLLALVFWVSALACVVNMRDEEFDGRNDKLIWFMIVFFAPFFGAVAFVLWRRARAEDRRSGAALKRAIDDAVRPHEESETT